MTLKPSNPSRLRRLLPAALVSVFIVAGCATTGGADPRDPLEPINRSIYRFNDTVDNLFLKPAAEAYRLVLPNVVQTGISNFFSNVNDVVIAFNNLLQGKVRQAGSDVSRIAINTTVGIFGFFDPASDMGFEKHNEDFGQTLGWWGVPDGPYLVLPFLGPSNVRDASGRVVDYYGDPVTYVDPTRARNQIYGLRIVNQRAELLSATSVLEAAALDPYIFLRDAYLQRRRNLVFDGNPPPEDFELEPKTEKPRSDAPADGKKADTAPAEKAPERAKQEPRSETPVVRFYGTFRSDGH